MRHGSAGLIVAVFVLTTAHTLAQEDARHPKTPASLIPPAPFVTTPLPATTPKPTTPHENITTTPPPSPHNTTTTIITTTPTSTHNTTTAVITTTHPSPQNTTTANVTTVSPTTHNTTTTPIPPTPTPTTNVTVGNYTVKDGGKLCIMVQAAIQIQVNNSEMVGTYIIPGDQGSNGTCEKNTANLKITLKEGYLSMTFYKNDTTNMVFVSAVAVNLNYAFKVGELKHLERKNDTLQLFSMKTGHSYSCKSESIFLGDGAYLQFSQDWMQAFNFTNNQFGPMDMCKADQLNYRVAIGVGVVLLILIIIVVVAYLISRRRKTDGYQPL